MTRTTSSVDAAFIRPPSMRGSTNVPSPTRVIRPGRPAAVSRYKMRHHALRQAVGLDPPVERERAQRRDEPPVRPDRAPDQPLAREVVEPAGAAVPLSGGEHERQVARAAGLAKRFASAMRSSSGTAIPTNPPTASVSPSRINRAAASGVMTFVRRPAVTAPRYPIRAPASHQSRPVAHGRAARGSPPGGRSATVSWIPRARRLDDRHQATAAHQFRATRRTTTRAARQMHAGRS